MRGDGRSPNLLTTVGSATQRYDVLPYRGNQEYLILGAAVGQNYQLPDATQEPFIPNKKTVEKVVYNQSSEIIGICAYGSTTIIHRIPPRGTGRYLLAAKATPAGTWYTWLDNCESCGGNKVVYGGFEVYATSGGSNAGGYHYILNSAISRSSNSADAAAVAAMGFTDSWWYGYAGLVANGAAYVRLGGSTIPTGWLLTNGPYAHTARISLDALPTAAEDWIMRVSLFGTANDNIGVILDRTMANPGNYYLYAIAGGVPAAPVDTTIAAVARTSTGIHYEKARAGNRTDVWINRVWRGTIAGAPQVAQVSPQMMCIGLATAGGTTRAMAASMHRLIHAPVNGVL
jgi:hypothetical protein